MGDTQPIAGGQIADVRGLQLGWWQLRRYGCAAAGRILPTPLFAGRRAERSTARGHRHISRPSRPRRRPMSNVTLFFLFSGAIWRAKNAALHRSLTAGVDLPPPQPQSTTL